MALRVFKFADVIQSLVGRAESNWHQEKTAQLNEEVGPTSLRLSAKTKRFYELQAAELGVSLNQAILMVLNGVAEVSSIRPGGNTVLTGERFVSVFESHELTVLEAASMLKKFGIRASDLSNPGTLIDQLSPEAVLWIANTFKISEKWLNDKSDFPFDGRDEFRWYKSIAGLAGSICELAREGKKPILHFFCSEEAKIDDAFEDNDKGNLPAQDVGMILEFTAEKIGDKPVQVFWRGEIQRWNYENCRLFYKAMLMWSIAAEKRRHYCFNWRAHYFPESTFRALSDGKIMPVQAFKGPCRAWFVDDYLDDVSSNKERAEIEHVVNRYKSYHMDELLADTHWLT